MTRSKTTIRRERVCLCETMPAARAVWDFFVRSRNWPIGAVVSLRFVLWSFSLRKHKWPEHEIRTAVTRLANCGALEQAGRMENGTPKYRAIEGV